MSAPNPGLAAEPGRVASALAGIASASIEEALERIAAVVHAELPADLVAVELAEGVEPPHDPSRAGVVGHSFSDTPPARRLRSLVAEGVRPDRIPEGALDRHGSSGALARLLAGGEEHGATLALAGVGSLGRVRVLGLPGGTPLPASCGATLAAMAPEIALAARLHQLGARERRARELLLGLVAASDAGVIVSDAAGRLSAANRAADRLMGVDLSALTGRPLAELAHERLKWRMKNPDDYGDRLAELLGDPDAAGTVEAETVDGRTIEHHSVPVRDGWGEPIGRVELLRDITATRAALIAAQRLAEERADLHQREERLAHEETRLARAGHMLASSLTEADVLEELLTQAIDLVGCEKAAVLRLDPRGDVMPAAVRGWHDMAATVAHMGLSLGEGAAGQALLSRRPFICNDAAAEARVSARLTRPEGIHSFMHVPLEVGERLYGLLSLNSTRPRAFGERELRLAGELSRHTASALTNALAFEQERHIAATLQHALLAEDLPKVAGLELAALYQPAAGSQVGGDLYNAWVLPGGELAVLLGDVSGKGVEAAGVTAMVRYMTEALSQQEAAPGRLLTALNELVCPRLADGSLVTVFLAVITADGDRLRWSSAGHPPPFLVVAGGEVRGLEDPGPPCGIFPASRYDDHEERLGAGDVLFAYTDGLTESRRGGRMFGEDNVRDALLAALDEPPRALARSVYAAARGWSEGGIADDVAIAVVKRAADGARRSNGAALPPADADDDTPVAGRSG